MIIDKSCVLSFWRVSQRSRVTLVKNEMGGAHICTPPNRFRHYAKIDCCCTTPSNLKSKSCSVSTIAVLQNSKKRMARRNSDCLNLLRNECVIFIMTSLSRGHGISLLRVCTSPPDQNSLEAVLLSAESSSLFIVHLHLCSSSLIFEFRSYSMSVLAEFDAYTFEVFLYGRSVNTLRECIS